jgi:hypothetical protein
MGGIHDAVRVLSSNAIPLRIPLRSQAQSKAPAMTIFFGSCLKHGFQQTGLVVDQHFSSIAQAANTLICHSCGILGLLVRLDFCPLNAPPG